MQIGKVIGNVWATKKDEHLNGSKLLIVTPIDVRDNSEGVPFVVADLVGAGIGEIVLCVMGSVAEHFSRDVQIRVDAVIVGIVDGVELR